MKVYGKLNSAREAVRIYNDSRSMITDLYKIYEEKFNRTITIPPNDTLYDDIRRWIHSETNPRASIFRTTNNFVPMKLPTSGTSFKVNIGGHKVKTFIKPLPKTSAMRMSNYFDDDTSDDEDRVGINFVVKSKAAERAVFAFLQDRLDAIKKRNRPLKKFIPGKYGWESTELVRRDLKTVHLLPGVKEDLVKDIASYEADHQRYSDLGVPYHRGFLFYGEPGTGKSSVIRALASHFDRNLFAISLASIEDDDELIDLVSNLHPRSILLIEDIDIARDQISREGNSNGGVTLSALLNCLDGIHSPDDFIFIATTNDDSNFDKALVRPGRIDKKIYFGYTEQKQFENMFEQFYGFVPDYQIGSEHVASEIVEVFKRNLHDGHAAIEDFKNSERF